MRGNGKQNTTLKRNALQVLFNFSPQQICSDPKRTIKFHSTHFLSFFCLSYRIHDFNSPPVTRFDSLSRLCSLDCLAIDSATGFSWAQWCANREAAMATSVMVNPWNNQVHPLLRRHYKKDSRFVLDLYTLTYDNHESLDSLGDLSAVSKVLRVITYGQCRVVFVNSLF